MALPCLNWCDRAQRPRWFQVVVFVVIVLSTVQIFDSDSDHDNDITTTRDAGPGISAAKHSCGDVKIPRPFLDRSL
jgi:hypothetical protein